MRRIIKKMILLFVVLISGFLFAQFTLTLKADDIVDTGIAGDANRDETVDVKDLIRAKRFAKDLQDQVPVEERIAISADIDLDKDLNINDTDTQYLRVVLVGEYHATVIPDNQDVDVGKYDKADDTFDIAIPKGVKLADDAQLVSATFQRHASISTQPFTTLSYADGVATLNNSLLGNRAFDDIQLVFETGAARVDVIRIPIDCFAMVINDEAELNRFPIVAQTYPEGYYILGNDIYCEGTYTSNHTEPFTGTFNGMVHTIYNMNVVSGDEWVGGIFGRQLGRDNGVYATVRNLSFVNASYTGNGGFLGTITVADIDNVYIDIAMKQCGTGTYAGATAVIGTNTLGALSLDGVLINYRTPLAAGATTGTAVYEMHNVPNSYKGLYVIGADRMGVTLDSSIEDTFVGGAYPTKAAFLEAVSKEEVHLSSWDTGFWKMSDKEVPIPIPLAPYNDMYLDTGILADFMETMYKNNVSEGQAVGTLPKKAEVLSQYKDADDTVADGVLKITANQNASGKFDFSIRFGEKVPYKEIEELTIKIAHTNINSDGPLKTFFVTSNTEGGEIWVDDGRYAFFEVLENTWTTITIPDGVLQHAQDEEGYISSLSFFCDNGIVDATSPATIYVDEVAYKMKDLYADTEEMYLGIFSSPLPNQESYEECAAAGFNYMLMDEDFDNYRGSDMQKTTLEFCNRAGLKALVMAMNYQKTENTVVDDTDYTQFPAYGGSFYWDEPYPKHIDQIATKAMEYQQQYPNSIFTVNLHPCIPFRKMLNIDCYYNKKFYTYEEYLSDYKTKVLDQLTGKKMLSVDIYPLLKDDDDTNQILKEYLYNLEATAKVARGTDIMTHYYILTHGHSDKRDITSIADINFQYYTGMAYGVQGFSCFTYKQQKSDAFLGHDALVNWDITEGILTSYKTAIYDYVKNANANLRAFEKVYLSFDWQKTMALEGTKDTETNNCYSLLTENATVIDGINSATGTQDTLIGYFTDSYDRKGYMVTNFSEPSKGLTNEVELQIEDAFKVRVYQNGTMTEVRTQNGTVKLSLPAGEGAFLLVL